MGGPSFYPWAVLYARICRTVDRIRSLRKAGRLRVAARRAMWRL